MPLERKHYRRLWEIARKTEPFADRLIYDQYADILAKREGFVVCNAEGSVVGSILLSDYVPGLNVISHVVIAPEYRGRWLNKTMLRIFFEMIFVRLGLPKISSYAIAGLGETSLAIARFLKGLGFEQEGFARQAARAPGSGKCYDVALFGMLREECPWI